MANTGIHRTHHRMSQDRRAHMLTLSGVVLMLGFMVLATTMVTLNNLEDRTNRDQQIGLVGDFDDLLRDFNQTLQGIVPPGSLEIDAFLNHSSATQAILQEEAAQSGIYASIHLVDPPPNEAFVRPSRCMGWSPEDSEQGVIMGWHATTRELGINGAVYEVRMTDGKHMITLTYYLKLHDCIQDRLYTHIHDAWADKGSETDWRHSWGKNGETFNLTETNRESRQEDASPSIDPDSLITDQWNQPMNLQQADGRTAKYPSKEAPRNHIRFQLEAPTGMQPGDHLEDPRFQVIAAHNLAPREGQDQDLLLRVYHPATNSTPAISKVVGPLDTSLRTFLLNVSESPTGNEAWSHGEIVDSLWELTVVGSHNPNREVYVDHFNMTGGLTTFTPYRLNATLAWEEIPSIYTDHELTMHYRIEPGTPDETFRLETRDTGPGGNGTWWTLAELQAEEGAGVWQWRTLHLGFELENDLEKHLEFRVVDQDHSDTQIPEDKDTIEIDLMRVTSRFTV